MFRVVVLLVALVAVRAPSLPPCFERPTFVDPPWVKGADWCLEEVYQDDARAVLAFTALAAAPDGTLYAASPLTGQVIAFTDQDGDGLPESPSAAIDGLTAPNGLAYHNDALYISGGTNLYRWQDDELTVLVDDLPDSGFWSGGLTVGADKRLYVGVLTPCDQCQPEAGQGAIWSFALDGSGGEIVATGFRAPTDVAFLQGALWTVDSAPPNFDAAPDGDELNRVTPGAFYGWPQCVGTVANPAFDTTSPACADDAPTLTLPTHSAPLGLAAYTSNTFPAIQNTLLLTLSGSYNRADLTGFAVAAVTIDRAGRPSAVRVILPEQTRTPEQPVFSLQEMQYRGSGVWPERPLDVAVSADGWIYISVSGGRILALRPNG